MDYLTLYRGDYTRIRKFAFHKTNRNCFVGQGIYLTDSIEIADTYRTKGADWDIDNHVMWSFDKNFMNRIKNHVKTSLNFMNEAQANRVKNQQKK